jgi:hypothetical protein
MHVLKQSEKFITGRQTNQVKASVPLCLRFTPIIYGFQRRVNKQFIRSIGRLCFSDDATVSYHYSRRRVVGILVVLLGIELRIAWI